MGDLRPDFSRSEFRCAHCGRVGDLSPRLLDMLQRARDMKGKPLRIVSGWRCAEHNRQVGGIPGSQHLHGRAADVPGGYLTSSEWIACGAIGVGVRRGRVIHVDVTPNARPFTFAD